VRSTIYVICALRAHRVRPLRVFLLYRVGNLIHAYSTKNRPFRASAEVLANYRTESGRDYTPFLQIGEEHADRGVTLHLPGRCWTHAEQASFVLTSVLLVFSLLSFPPRAVRI
jgi:hypothetical protein